MTSIKYVTQEEMQNKTGLSQALGYSMPDENTIYLRKGMNKSLKKKVLAHEEEHMSKGEEGPFWQVAAPIIGGALGFLGSREEAKAQKEAAAMGANTADPFRQHRGRYAGMLNRFMTQGPQWPTGMLGYDQGGVLPYVNQGGATEGTTESTTGIPGEYASSDDWIRYLNQGAEAGFIPQGDISDIVKDVTMGDPLTGPRESWQSRLARGGYDLQPLEGFGGGGAGVGGGLDPSYAFRFNEGMRAVNRTAAASGMRLSGNRLYDLMNYGQNMASTEYANQFNRLAMLSGASSGSPAGAGQLLGQGYGNAASASARGYGALGYGAKGVFDAISGGGGGAGNVGAGSSNYQNISSYYKPSYNPAALGGSNWNIMGGL